MYNPQRASKKTGNFEGPPLVTQSGPYNVKPTARGGVPPLLWFNIVRVKRGGRDQIQDCYMESHLISPRSRSDLSDLSTGCGRRKSLVGIGIEDLISPRSRSDLSDLSTGCGRRKSLVGIGIEDLISPRSRSDLSDLSTG